MQYTSFSDVERLDADALKTLLIAGEPPERVWAAWALGLRHHQAFARELRATAAEEPHAGVRRHLVVVLAGAGERRSVLTHGRSRSGRARARHRAAIRRPARTDRRTTTRTISSRARWRRERRCSSWDASRDCAPDARPGLWTQWTPAWRAPIATCAGRPTRRSCDTAPARAAGRSWRATFLDVEPERPTRVNAVQLLLRCAGVEAGAAADRGRFVSRPPSSRGGRSACTRTAYASNGRTSKADRALPGRVGSIARWSSSPSVARVPRGPPCCDCSWQSGSRRSSSWEMRAEVLTRLRKCARPEPGRRWTNRSASCVRRWSEHVERAATAARDDPHDFEGIEGVRSGPAARERSRQSPIDPLSLPWFCEEEREILARLAALEVH